MSGSILEDYVAEDDLAAEFDKNPRTLKRWRDTGEGPPHLRIGHAIYYRRSAVRDWLLKREQEAA
jgi:hypothetical protein